MPPRRPPVPAQRPSLLDRLRPSLPDALVALAAFLLVVADLDPTGTYAWLPDGPGLTVDESFNVQQGVRLEVGSRYLLLGAVSWRELFGRAEDLGPEAPLGYHIADHPPLGRYLLGVSHNVVTSVAMPPDWPSPFVTAAARFGSAIAFGVTVFLVGRFAARHYGTAAGIAAAVSLILMPRVFGHAHIASLETMIGLFYTATVLSIATRWEPGTRVPLKAAFLGGALWGLALLTKVQAVLLPIPLTLWALAHWRLAAISPLAIFGLTGATVFFVGWPWLWLDPVDHVLEYLGRTTDRVSLPVWYLGQVFADKEVPWHYPFVMFAVTVPLGLHLLGLLGTFTPWKKGLRVITSVPLSLGRGVRGEGISPAPVGTLSTPNSHLSTRSQLSTLDSQLTHDPALQLLLASVAFPLLLFAIPGVAVYDGARLFLISFPLWAVVIGRGGGIAWSWLRTRTNPRLAAALAIIFLGTQTAGLIASRPTYLSYYSLLVGGLAGAERLGFELTYWGDSVTAELLDVAAQALPEGGTLAVAPVLHQFQLDDLLSQSPALRARRIRLVEYHQGQPADALLVFSRKASLPPKLRERLAAAEPVARMSKSGVTLAALYQPLPPETDRR